MKIPADTKPPIIPRKAERAAPTKAAPSSTSSPAAHVDVDKSDATIAPATAELSAHASAARSAHVARIKSSVQDGSYAVDISNLADSLLDAAQLEAQIRSAYDGK
ncbi:MAG TPA: flagellar biosynthesis anti-sigma factor FlgM [Myxococcota bacterium]